MWESKVDGRREIRGAYRLPRDSTLRFVTSATGGVLIRHASSLFGALQRVDHSDIRSYYVLTYRPSNPVFDGACSHHPGKDHTGGMTLHFHQVHPRAPR